MTNPSFVGVLKSRQLPGRQEAMRLAIGSPDSSPLMKHIAGLDKSHGPCPPGPMLESFRLSNLAGEERDALDF